MIGVQLRTRKPASTGATRSSPSAAYRKPARPSRAPAASGIDHDAVMRASLVRPDTQPAVGAIDTGYGDVVAAARESSRDAARPAPMQRAGGAPSRLKVTPPNDATEIEADRVADQVMRMPDPHAAPEIDGARGARGADSPGTVSRKCSACEGDDEKRIHRKRIDPDDEIHGKLDGAAPVIGNDLAGRIDGLGGGQALPTSERAFFEPRFGHDFSGVRVHTGSPAAGVAGELNARAFTRGSHIAFGAGAYAPGTDSGRRLLAHELTHVVQQGRASDGPVQRELVTPEPATPPAARPALTRPQIDAAIRFNRDHYDKPRTEQIQDIIGTPKTGTWTDDDILAVADLQERYGLFKDGMIGPRTFRFLDHETRLENLPTTNDNCPLAFSVAVDAPIIGPVAGGQRSITGHFAMRAQFSSYCGCAAYVYRQFVRGHWRRIRGGVVTDLGATFTHMPGGLPAAFQEDANTTTPALNYGHREQANEGTNNGYFDDPAAATPNQATGCHYLGDDTPGGADAVLAGDVFEILVAFRGEIRRNGAVVETKHWTAINGRFPVP
jgi:hypothetical protein